MTETITAEEIQETNFGEKVVLDSPYEARDYVAFMPWDNGDDTNPDEFEDSGDVPDFEFSDDFGAHHKWDADEYKWKVDVDAFEEIHAYFESVGFEVEVADSVYDAAY